MGSYSRRAWEKGAIQRETNEGSGGRWEAVFVVAQGGLGEGRGGGREEGRSGRGQGWVSLYVGPLSVGPGWEVWCG